MDRPWSWELCQIQRAKLEALALEVARLPATVSQDPLIPAVPPWESGILRKQVEEAFMTRPETAVPEHGMVLVRIINRANLESLVILFIQVQTG